MEKELNKILIKLCWIYQLEYDDLFNYNKKDFRAEKRYMIYYLLYTNLQMRKSQLARLLNRNHATIIHGINQAEWIIKYDINLRNKTYEAQAYMNEIRKQIFPDYTKNKRNTMNFSRKNFINQLNIRKEKVIKWNYQKH